MATTFDFTYSNSAGSGIPKLADIINAAGIEVDHWSNELDMLFNAVDDPAELRGFESDVESMYDFIANPMDYYVSFDKIYDNVWRVTLQLNGGHHVS